MLISEAVAGNWVKGPSGIVYLIRAVTPTRVLVTSDYTTRSYVTGGMANVVELDQIAFDRFTHCDPPVRYKTTRPGHHRTTPNPLRHRDGGRKLKPSQPGD